MDRMIKSYPAVADGDLMHCQREGVAYQANLGAVTARYDERYFEKVSSYEPNIESKVNRYRVELLDRHAPLGASLMDYGAGTGAFARCAKLAGYQVSAFEVMAPAVLMLKEQGLYSADMLTMFDVVSAWDVIEHLPDPGFLLRGLRYRATLLVSIPVFDSLSEVRSSKHYRPGEHLYYWTRSGFERWVALYGYRVLEFSDHEVRAGREQIGAWALRRDYSMNEELARHGN